jgi:hypothetical protein
MFRELFAKPGNIFVGGSPVRIACIAVENQRAGFQRFFEAFMSECNCLAVVVRTNDFKIHTFAHEPPASSTNPSLCHPGVLPGSSLRIVLPGQSAPAFARKRLLQGTLNGC